MAADQQRRGGRRGVFGEKKRWMKKLIIWRKRNVQSERVSWGVKRVDIVIGECVLYTKKIHIHIFKGTYNQNIVISKSN